MDRWYNEQSESVNFNQDYVAKYMYWFASIYNQIAVLMSMKALAYESNEDIYIHVQQVVKS